MALADESKDLKKKLEESEKRSQEAEQRAQQSKQRFINAKAIAESFKSKYDAEAKTVGNLRMTVSQHILEKGARNAQFEEAIQRIFNAEEENKQLKITQERDAHKRDTFYAKIEQLHKQLDKKESELDLEKKRAEEERAWAEKLESRFVVIDATFWKVYFPF